MIRNEIVQYIEKEIIPRYREFDPAHREDHAKEVISRSLSLSRHYNVDEEMIYVIAAFHDTGLCAGRDRHHIVSGEIIREDVNLKRWFTPGQLEIMAQAAEDHRASSGHEPRSVYGKIVAEADRLIDGETILRRTIQFSLSHYPDFDKEMHWQRVLEHLHEKYDYGGYLRLWIPESPNAMALERFRRTIHDEAELRSEFDRLYDSLI